jgi:hypothetical protein
MGNGKGNKPKKPDSGKESDGGKIGLTPQQISDYQTADALAAVTTALLEKYPNEIEQVETSHQSGTNSGTNKLTKVISITRTGFKKETINYYPDPLNLDIIQTYTFSAGQEFIFLNLIKHPVFNKMHGMEGEVGLKRIEFVRKMCDKLEEIRKSPELKKEFGAGVKNFTKLLSKFNIPIPEFFGKTEQLYGDKVISQAFYLTASINAIDSGFNQDEVLDPKIAKENAQCFALLSKIGSAVFEENPEFNSFKKDPYSAAHIREEFKNVNISEGYKNLTKHISENKEKNPAITNWLKKYNQDYYEAYNAHLNALNSIQNKFKNQNLPKAFVMGDPYPDNILTDEEGKKYMIDHEEFGYAFRIQEIALCINAANGIDSKTGKLNKTGAAILKGFNEIQSIEEKELRNLYSALAITSNYIANMRQFKVLEGNPKRSFMVELEKSLDFLKLSKTKSAEMEKNPYEVLGISRDLQENKVSAITYKPKPRCLIELIDRIISYIDLSKSTNIIGRG